MRKTILALVLGLALVAAALPLVSLAFRGDDPSGARPRSIDFTEVTTVAPQQTAAEMAARPCDGHEASDFVQS